MDNVESTREVLYTSTGYNTDVGSIVESPANKCCSKVVPDVTHLTRSKVKSAVEKQKNYKFCCMRLRQLTRYSYTECVFHFVFLPVI